MPRFLIIAGILAAALIFDPSDKIEVVELETVPPALNDEQVVHVPEVVAQKKSTTDADIVSSPEAVKAAAGVAAKADVQTTDNQAGEPFVAPLPQPVVQEVKSEPDTNEADRAAFAMLSPRERKTVAQRELKRLACYSGKIDGIWGKQSRAAIEEFNEHSGSFLDLDESVELLVALKKAPDRLCDKNCSGDACQIIASAQPTEGTEKQKTKTAKELPSYLPPWMRGEQVADADIDSEVSESYSATHTSVSQRVYKKKPRQVRRPIYRAVRKKKKDWLPDHWPGNR